MKFSDFAYILNCFLGEDLNTSDFTNALLLAVTNESVKPFLKGISPNTYKSYYNGQRQLTRISKRIIGHLDLDKFSEYTRGLDLQCKQEICNAIDKIDPSLDIDLFNFNYVCANIFKDIIVHSCMAKRKSQINCP